MKFTFGIVTIKKNEAGVDLCIDSIRKLEIPEYEIIFVGGDNRWGDPKIRHITFKETERQGWITRKKNLVVQIPLYDNIVFCHDYITFDLDWYSGYLKYGDNFHVCLNKILTQEGLRYRDWCFYAGFIKELPIEQKLKERIFSSANWSIPYSVTNKNLKHYQYISGAYWVAKKSVMLAVPLDEGLSWGQGEDVEWSQRVAKKYDFSFNTFSTVRLTRHKLPVFPEVEEQFIPVLEAI